MSALTGALYAALVIYLGGWLLDKWIGNFALLLLLLTVVTFAYWLAEKFFFQPRRVRAAKLYEEQVLARRAEIHKMGLESDVGNDLEETRARLLAQPWWLDWTAGLFPVIVIVFVLRSFLFEPFKIPSASMVPTLMVGDLILVNKYHYGIRLPVAGTKVIPNKDPARGDVIVFHYPRDPRVDYIKRVIGLPGDEISYLNSQLRINGQPIAVQPLGDDYDYDSNRYMTRFSEQLGPVTHKIQRYPQPREFNPAQVYDFPFKDQCTHSPEGTVCKVPKGHYFVMGDNRDNSEDSRYWGFVPDENIVGRAFFVWMNFGDLGRIGSFH